MSFAMSRLDEVVAWVLNFGEAATIESSGAARDAL